MGVDLVPTNPNNAYVIEEQTKKAFRLPNSKPLLIGRSLKRFAHLSTQISRKHVVLAVDQNHNDRVAIRWIGKSEMYLIMGSKPPMKAETGRVYYLTSRDSFYLARDQSDAFLHLFTVKIQRSRNKRKTNENLGANTMQSLKRRRNSRNRADNRPLMPSSVLNTEESVRPPSRPHAGLLSEPSAKRMRFSDPVRNVTVLEDLKHSNPQQTPHGIKQNTPKSCSSANRIANRSPLAKQLRQSFSTSQISTTSPQLDFSSGSETVVLKKTKTLAQLDSGTGFTDVHSGDTSSSGDFTLAFPSISSELNFDSAFVVEVISDSVVEFLNAHEDPNIRLILVEPLSGQHILSAVEKNIKDPRFCVLKGDVTTIKTAYGIHCKYVVNPTNWRFTSRHGLSKNIRKISGDCLQRQSVALYGTGKVGQACPVFLPQESLFRRREGVSCVLQIVGPNMDPNKPDCLNGNYSVGCKLLKKSYLSVLNTFYDLEVKNRAICEKQKKPRRLNQKSSSEEMQKSDESDSESSAQIYSDSDGCTAGGYVSQESVEIIKTSKNSRIVVKKQISSASRIQRSLSNLSDAIHSSSDAVRNVPQITWCISFKYLGTRELLINVPRVCASWYLAAKKPLCWHTARMGKLKRKVNNMKQMTVLIQSRWTMTRTIDLSGCMSISNSSLAVISQNCKKLHTLNLSYCMLVSDEGISALIEAPTLDPLSHSGHPTLEKTDTKTCLLADFRSNRHIIENLKILRLRACRRLTDKSMVLLSMCSLEVLDLQFCGVSDEGMRSLSSGKCRGSLRDLKLFHCRLITDKGIEYLSKGCLKLTHLMLPSAVTDCGLRHLSRAVSEQSRRTCLKSLKLLSCWNITDEGLKTLLKYSPELTTLEFWFCKKLSEEFLLALRLKGISVNTKS